MSRAGNPELPALGEVAAEDRDEGELMPPLPVLTSDSLCAAGLHPAPAANSIRYWDQRRFEEWIRTMPLVAKGPAGGAPARARPPPVHSRTTHAQMRKAVSEAMDATSNARLNSIPEIKFPGGRGDCWTSKFRKSGSGSKKHKSQSYSFRSLYKLACLPPDSEKLIQEEHLKRMKDQGYDVQQKDSFIRSRSSSTLRVQCGPKPKVVKNDLELVTADQLAEKKNSEGHNIERAKGPDRHVCNLPGCPSAAIRVRSGKVPKLKKSGISKLKRNNKDKHATIEVPKSGRKETVANPKRTTTKITNSNERRQKLETEKKFLKNDYEVEEKEYKQLTTMYPENDDEHCQGVKLPFLSIQKAGNQQTGVRRYFSIEKKKYVNLPPLPKSAPGKPNSCTNPELLKRTTIKKTESATGSICATQSGGISKEDSKLANIMLSTWINIQKHKTSHNK